MKLPNEALSPQSSPSGRGGREAPGEGDAAAPRRLRLTTTRAVWLFLIVLTLIRLSMLATKDLETDEAHYFMWSERLAPGYFSKGPGVAVVIRASTAVFGANEFGVRFLSPVLAAGETLLIVGGLEMLWRWAAQRWMPQIYERHPSLIFDSV